MGDELTWLPGWQLRRLVVDGEVTATEVAEHVLGRIEALEPALHAFFTVTPELALEQAAAADRARTAGEPLGPLHGVPISIKDHLEVAGVRCTYGQAEHADHVPRHDAVAVERVRAAGAVLVGKTSLPGLVEPGVVDEPTVNPWDTGRVPGGSSAGAAASVAAGVGPLAIGSDSGGSIRVPAAYCGVVGLHSTPGRAPGYNYKPELYAGIWGSSVGPVCRDVRDAATVLQVLAGPDWRDLTGSWTEPPDYLAALDQGAAGLRLAWTADFGFAARYGTAETRAVVDTAAVAASRFADLGAEVEEHGLTVEDPAPVLGAIVVALRDAPSPPADSRAEALRVLRPLDESYVEALHGRARIGQAFGRVFAEHDLIVAPAARSVAPTLESGASPRRRRAITATRASSTSSGYRPSSSRAASSTGCRSASS